MSEPMLTVDNLLKHYIHIPDYLFHDLHSLHGNNIW
jgi:hypothetical protein